MAGHLPSTQAWDVKLVFSLLVSECCKTLKPMSSARRALNTPWPATVTRLTSVGPPGLNLTCNNTSCCLPL